jgi:two-component system chemotaxis sensor kinase CheA
MSDFQGMEELLQDFLQEAGELLSDVDNKLVELEKRPGDLSLLNEIFRGFHTVKGGAGFLNAGELVTLCHLTENLFDKLRNRELTLSPTLMDYIMAATAAARGMFVPLSQGTQPGPAEPTLLADLRAAIEGKVADSAPVACATAPPATAGDEPDWAALLRAVNGAHASAAEPKPSAAAAAPYGRRASDNPEVEVARAGRRESDKVVVAKETTIRIDTTRLDQVLVLSGEIGLTKNRLNCLRSDVLAGKRDSNTLRSLDEAIGQLDLLVSDLQNAVMKTRMQPIGRLFQKYPRMARDLARQLGRELELVVEGEETELDRTMIEELSDPLVHLVRNAVDHGIETPEQRRAAGKPEKATVLLSAQQVGDHVLVQIRDDGRGMNAEMIKQKAIEKGLLDGDAAAALDERHALQLIFLPGFSTKDQISSVSGRGVGMDVVRTNIQKLNGRIDIESVEGTGTTFKISLPLTLAILPVLVVRLNNQSFAVPLSMVREIITIKPNEVQAVSGRATLVVRDEVLPLRSLAGLLDYPQERVPEYGVLMQSSLRSFVLAVDGFVGRDDVVMKPLEDIRPKGVAGATLSGDGSVVLVLDMEELLAANGGMLGADEFNLAA